MAKAYNYKTKNQEAWKEFRKNCIELDCSIIEGLDLAVKDFNTKYGKR